MDEEVKGQNNPRDDLFKQLAEQVDDESDKEVVDVPDEAHDQVKEIAEESSEEVSKVEDTSVSQTSKKKFKVNGREVELTDEEIAERVQKSEAADEKFRQAAELRKQAEEFSKPQNTEGVMDDLALARAIQMGTEEEAVKAIQSIKARPSFNQDDLVKMVDQRHSFLKQQESFAERNKDIFEVPYLDAAAGLAYNRMRSSGDSRDHWTLLQAAADEVRQWYGKVSGNESFKQKQERKQTLTVVPTASAKQSLGTDEEPTQTDADIIAEMAKKRGQQYG